MGEIEDLGDFLAAVVDEAHAPRAERGRAGVGHGHGEIGGHRGVRSASARHQDIPGLQRRLRLVSGDGPAETFDIALRAAARRADPGTPREEARQEERCGGARDDPLDGPMEGPAGRRLTVRQGAPTLNG